MKTVLFLLTLSICTIAFCQVSNENELSKNERRALLKARKSDRMAVVIDSIFKTRYENYLSMDEQIVNEIKNSLLTADPEQYVFTSTLSKEELFVELNRWVALNYKSANDVIQMSDKDAGVIIVKGSGKIIMPNLFKLGMIKTKLVPFMINHYMRHTLQIDVKEKRFKVSLVYSDIESGDPGYYYTIPFSYSINNFNGDEIFLKESTSIMLSKSRRELVEENIPNYIDMVNKKFDDWKYSFLNDIKQAGKSKPVKW